MKYLKLAILLCMFALFASCAAEVSSGVVIRYALNCEEETYQDGTSVKLHTSGSFDLAVADFHSGNIGYELGLAIVHEGYEVSSSIAAGIEGFNRFYTRYFQIEYEVPTDWDEIPSVKIPMGSTMDPEGSLYARINILPETVQAAINENYRKNSYKSHQPYSTLRPSATTSCNDGNVLEQCMGYQCTSEGKCATACNYDAMNACAPGYFCDIGPGKTGYCRKQCTPGISDCPAFNDPATGETLLEFECVKDACIPKGTTVNPFVPEPIIVKVKLVGVNNNGNTVETNNFYFPLRVGRQNLLSFDRSFCNCSPIIYTDETGEVASDDSNACYKKVYDEVEDECKHLVLRQDSLLGSIQCAWISNCFNFLCN